MDIIEVFNIQKVVELEFLIQISLLLVVAIIGGWLAKKISMPKVLGQIIMGIIIGPTVLNMIGHSDQEIIQVISQIGVIFLMFLAGLETDIKEFKASGKGALIIALAGLISTLVLGTILPLIFFEQYLPTGNQKLLFAMYIGTILTATSVSISVSVLKDIEQLRSKQGISIIEGALIDDVLGIILLAIVSGMVTPSGNSNPVKLIINIVCFFIMVIFIGFIISKGKTKFAQENVWTDGIITFSIVVCFVFAYIAELFNVAAITGAYFAGVTFATTPYRHKIVSKIQSLAYLFFTPIFFVSIGLRVMISSDMIHYIGYASVILLIAIFGKILGCGVGAKISGFSKRHSLQIGIGMIARAEVALIVANQGLNSGIITTETFNSIVLLVVVSTLLSPPLLKYLFKDEEPLSNFANVENNEEIED